jgi:sugar lactone lactonase YvrE
MAKRRRPSRLVVAAAGVAAALVAAGAPGAAPAPAATPTGLLAGSQSTIRVGGAPDRAAVGQGAVWVGDLGNLFRVDPATRRVVRVPDATTPFAIDDHAVWARLRDRFDTIARIDPASRIVVATFPVSGTPAAIASTPAGVWVADSSGTVTRIDPATNTVAATLPLGQIAFGVGAGPDTVWVSGRSRSSVAPPLSPADARRADDSRPLLWRIDPATNQVVATVDARGNCAAVVTTATTTWAGCGTVQRLPDSTGTLVDTGADARTGLAAGDGAVWALAPDGTVRRIAPTTGRVDGTIRVPAGSEGIAVGAGSVWVADPRLHDPASRDGTGVLTRVRLASPTR